MTDVIKDRPPVYDQIVAAIGVPPESAVYTYGDVIYCPSSATISSDVAAHEEVHVKQQAEIGRDEWWRRYLAEPSFRYEQELAAYREQFRFVKRAFKDRNAQTRAVVDLARSLSSAMYGRMVGFHEAMNAIKA